MAMTYGILGHSGLPGQFWVAHQGPRKEATGAGHKGGGPLSPEAQARGSPPCHLPHGVSEPPGSSPGLLSLAGRWDISKHSSPALGETGRACQAS